MSKHIYDIVFYTPGISGFGYLMRFHALCEQCKSYNIKCLFVFGADFIPDAINNSSYDKIVLPKSHYSHTADEVERKYLLDLHSRFIKDVIMKFKPRYFVQSHVSDLFYDLEYDNFDIWGDTIRVLLLRDILFSREKFEYKERMGENFVRNMDLYFKHIFVAGSRHLFDISQVYSLPNSIERKISYIGYILEIFSSKIALKDRLRYDVVISFGSGQNRLDHMRFVKDVLLTYFKNSGHSVCVISGKYHPDFFSSLVGACSNISVLPFAERSTYLQLLSGARFCILSGGYNSFVEAIRLGIPAFVLRSEQFSEVDIRCQVFADTIGVIDINSSMDIEFEKFIGNWSVDPSKLPELNGSLEFFRLLGYCG